MKSFKLKSGLELPLLSLKGKPYLLVGHRLVWLDNEVKSYDIHTELLVLTDEQTVARATVTLFKDDGSVLRKASASKRETKKDFSDHTEKAETGAMGRALAMLGMGTQFALADLDEGDRLADAPIPAPAKPARTVKPNPTRAESPTEASVEVTATKTSTDTASDTATSGSIPSTTKPSSFRRDSKPAPSKSNGGGWA